MEIKIENQNEELCKGFPREFQEYIRYCRGLEYKEDPEYNYFKKLFNNVLKGNSENNFDWDNNKTIITVTTSSTSKKPKNFENKNEKYKNTNAPSQKVLSDFANIKNFQTIGSKEDFINTNRSKVNNFSRLKYRDKYDDMAEFTEEENYIKNKCPNTFGKIHSKQQLERSFKLDKKYNDDICTIF